MFYFFFKSHQWGQVIYANTQRNFERNLSFTAKRHLNVFFTTTRVLWTGKLSGDWSSPGFRATVCVNYIYIYIFILITK